MVSETNSVHAGCLFPVSFKTRDRHRDEFCDVFPFHEIALLCLVAPTRPRLHGFRVRSMVEDACAWSSPSLRDSSTTLQGFFQPRFIGKECRIFNASQLLRDTGRSQLSRRLKGRARSPRYSSLTELLMYQW